VSPTKNYELAMVADTGLQHFYPQKFLRSSNLVRSMDACVCTSVLHLSPRAPPFPLFLTSSAFSTTIVAIFSLSPHHNKRFTSQLTHTPPKEKDAHAHRSSFLSLRSGLTLTALF